MRGLGLCLAAITLSAGSPASAQQGASSGWFPIPPNAMFETGDSWNDRGMTYRLYGVQACIRGTSFTNTLGVKRDCGEASLAMLVALIRDLTPQCYQAASLPQAHTIFVFCVATPKRGAGAGSRIDLGTALIASGYAFASLTPDGRPVHAPYFVAQIVAGRAKTGLWAFADLPEPNAIILGALRRQQPEVQGSNSASQR